jgi:hypothetical protein
MKGAFFVVSVSVMLAALADGCVAKPSGSSCVTGAVSSCACAGGGTGTQTCQSDGTLGACSCSGSSASSSGGGDGGGASCDRPTAGSSCTSASVKEGQLVCGYDATCKSADGSVLYCQSGKLQNVFACPGLEGCGEVSNNSILCGTASTGSGAYYAKSGAPCAQDDTVACSFDRQIVEQCIGGIWVDTVHCPPSNCGYVDLGNGPGIQCANGGYTLGDTCAFQAGGVVCSTDLTKILQCSNAKATLFKDCGSQKCTSVACNSGTGSCLDCQ